MEPRNNNYLQMSNQESKTNEGRDKRNLLKTFQSKKQQKTCSPFVSSIVILSILSLANSSFAFPARIKKEAKFWFTQEDQAKEVLGYINIDIDDSRIEIEYCTIHNLCNAKGFYILSENRFIQRPGWVSISDLCDDPSVSIPFLPICLWEGRGRNTRYINVISPVEDQPTSIRNYYYNQLYTNNKLMHNVGLITPSVKEIRNLYNDCRQ
ncbi:hypothetical protein [Nostoc sp.]|uniref:hypothetical protein n=1 Tax=Nostoc sp. TaxID=1180 RepID=UPI002FF76DBD